MLGRDKKRKRRKKDFLRNKAPSSSRYPGIDSANDVSEFEKGEYLSREKFEKGDFSELKSLLRLFYF